MDKYIDIFNEYYKQFDDSNEKIKYKYDHTFRVVEYAKRIADGLDLSQDEKDIALACALYHDIGRFNQVTMYNTYEDNISIDHGDEGAKVLKELGIDNEIIILSTKYHNKYEIPDDASDEVKFYCNIVRDADKIDIMDNQAFNCEDKEFKMVKGVEYYFENHLLVPNNLSLNKSDTFLILRTLVFIFDINYKPSFEIIKEKDFVNTKCNAILEKFDEQSIKNIKSMLNNFVEEGCR